MDEKSSYRQRHPLLSGCLLLLVAGLLFGAGVSFFIGSLMRTDPTRAGVGVIEVHGVIGSADQIIEELTEFRRQDKVRAIVLRIDSPGGAVGASQELYAEVKRTNEVKPVVASMGSVAASGGLYAALGAEQIIANPGTLTGSIGVIIKFANLEELLQKIGYRSETIKSGELKDAGAIDRALTDREREMLREMIHGVHDQFVNDLALSRQLPDDRVREFADGRIFSGAQALELELIDALGNLNDATMLAAELGGLDGDEVPPLIYPPRRDISLLSLLVGSTLGDRLVPNLDLTPVLAYEWTIAR